MTGAAQPPQPPPTAAPPGAPRRRVDPLLLVVLGVLAGIAVSLSHARAGMYVVAASLALAAVLRLVLRPPDAGLLVVRRKQIDVAILSGLALALLVMASVTPFHSQG